MSRRQSHGLRISELCCLERGLVNLGVDVIRTSRSKTVAGYRGIDVMLAPLHQDLSEHLAQPTAFGRSRDPLVPSANGNGLAASNIRQRVVAKVVAEANGLLRERGVSEIVECTPHTLRRTYISLLLAAGCDPAYVQQQVGHTDPMLTLRIYQQPLKRKRRKEYREASQRAARHVARGALEAAGPRTRKRVGPNSGPNSLFVAD
jgi:integrase